MLLENMAIQVSNTDQQSN